MLIGGDAGRQCPAAGLVDEIHIYLAPVLLGGGVPMFEAASGGAAALELIELSRAGTITNLCFRVGAQPTL